MQPEFTQAEVTMFLENQQRMAEDISEIKATLKELAQIGLFLRRDQDELKEAHKKQNERMSILEETHRNCPARLRHQAWALSAKDLAWLLAFLAALAGAMIVWKR